MKTDMQHSPWGEVQDIDPIADGIEFLFTAGHGGMKLSDERAKAVKAKFPNFTTWVGDCHYYEEDSDVAVVVATFPECFSPEAVKQAENAINADKKYFGI